MEVWRKSFRPQEDLSARICRTITLTVHWRLISHYLRPLFFQLSSSNLTGCFIHRPDWRCIAKRLNSYKVNRVPIKLYYSARFNWIYSIVRVVPNSLSHVDLGCSRPRTWDRPINPGNRSDGPQLFMRDENVVEVIRSWLGNSFLLRVFGMAEITQRKVKLFAIV